MEDALLVARCVNHADDDAFVELTRRHRASVLRFAASILGRRFASEAEEVAQEVFVRVRGALPSFRGDSLFRTWLYRITFNQASTVKRRARNRGLHVSDDALALIPSPEAGPDETVDLRRRARVIDECMSRLPAAYRVPMRMHYWSGSGIGEIATRLAVPESTVKSRMFTARQQLRVMLRERGYGQ